MLTPHYEMVPVTLPIDKHLPCLLEQLMREKILVLQADPGAGKTTRLPPALLDLFPDGEVLVLEPRRLAARLAAERVASELDLSVGGIVGYQTRTASRRSSSTRLCFMTEGTLLRRFSSDAQLSGVRCVVLDEFHERHLHTDTALALLQNLRSRSREDLCLVVMSATLAADEVAAFLHTTATRVEAPMYPVDIDFEAQQDRRPLEERVQSVCRRAMAAGIRSKKENASVLVFLPGAFEIQKCLQLCRADAQARGFEAFALYGRQSPEDQDRALRYDGTSRLIFATNVAESSLTVEGVGTVVDSGLGRRLTLDTRTGLSRLETRPVSQASATQRSGRAGRLGPGVCYRLYTRFDFEHRPAFDTPEILRSDLCELVLLLASLDFHPDTYPPFLCDLPPDGIDYARRLLVDLGAFSPGKGADSRSVLSSLGANMARLALHPRLSRGLLALPDESLELGAELAAFLEEGLESSLASSEATAGANVPSDAIAQMDAVRLGAYGKKRRSAQAKLAGRILRSLRSARRAKKADIDDGYLIDPSASDDEQLLRALFLMYPDRVAKKRDAKGSAFLFASGGAAELSSKSTVSEAEYIIALSVQTRRGADARIHSASAIEENWLLEYQSKKIVEEHSYTFDSKRGIVLSRNALYLGSILLDESHRPAEPSAEVSRVLVDEVLARGAEKVWNLEALRDLFARIHFAEQHRQEALGLPSFEVFLRQILNTLASGQSSLAALENQRPIDAVWQCFGPGLLADLDRVAPTHASLPGRAKVPIKYSVGAEPMIASRLQDFFGLVETPRIAEGCVPLLLHLLAPNRRAVQVTKDLAGFWEKHYPGLRKTLMRRYPKHAWPEDPNR